jgi:uncharacterized protein
MPNLSAQTATEVVRHAGGEIVGRTKLQKITYLMSITGLLEGADLHFLYKHYGPYSEDLATGARDAGFLGLLRVDERIASWGGTYSVYQSVTPANERVPLAVEAAAADSVELELAATAAFLAREGINDPWGETARRKPEKSAEDTLAKAKELYRTLSRIETPIGLPEIA